MMKFLTKIKQHVLFNFKIYAVIFTAFLVGALVAAFSVFNLSDAEVKALTLYTDDFFANIYETGADRMLIFKISAWDSLKSVLAAAMFSMMIIGAPFIAVISAGYGYTALFTLCIFFKCYGIRAVLFFLVGLLPHWIILFPVYGFYLAECLKFSVSAISGGISKNPGKSVLHFFVTAVFVYLLTLCASLLTAYVEPWLISFISKYYIQ